MKHLEFPPDFLWGAATAAFQVEGAADLRGPCIWDTFCRQPGRIALDQDGRMAVDQYHRYQEDIALMRWMGLKAYRFSISWPRIFPEGSGATNLAGLDYYQRLVDALLEAGIEPWVTLYHWDLPQSLQDRFGGWLSRSTSHLFADYAGLISKVLSDRVKHFFTINEFWCFTDAGYSVGEFAPGLKLSRAERNKVRHHALLGHGLAVKAIRASARQSLRVGLAENPQIPVPVLETPRHIDAARLAFGHLNAHFLIPILRGAYPTTYLQEEGDAAPELLPGDLETISTPLDFVGLNLYTPTYVQAIDAEPGYQVVSHQEHYPRMDIPWLFLGPSITYWGPRWIQEEGKGLDIYISENGCAAADRPRSDGQILDTERVMYLRTHFDSAQRAVAAGYPLKGYFVWSLLDNFEWCWGYTKRFGLIYVNYSDLSRRAKLSAEFYRQVIGIGSPISLD